MSRSQGFWLVGQGSACSKRVPEVLTRASSRYDLEMGPKGRMGWRRCGRAGRS